MHTADILQLRKSFTRLEARGHLGALMFYQRLFEMAPQVRPLFVGDIERQSKKLMQMLTAALALAEKPMEFRTTLEELGARHVAYGAKAAHYPVVVECLLQMLEEVLAADFNSNLRKLWADLLNSIAAVMMEGAAKAEGAPGKIPMCDRKG